MASFASRLATAARSAVAGWRGAPVSNATHTSTSGHKGSELYDWLTDGLASSGITVTEQTAMRVSAVHACVGIISDAISTLPIATYRRTDTAKEAVKSEHWWLLNEAPLPAWSASSFWRAMMRSRLLHGDAFAVIERQGPKVSGLRWVHPQNVEVYVSSVTGALAYAVLDQVSGKRTPYVAEDMIHVSGDGFDGYRSMSPLRYVLQETAGVALAAQDYSSRFFANSARPDYVMKAPGKIEPDQVERLRTMIADKFSGANQHKPMILTGGMEIQTVTMTSADAQLLEARQFQVSDIARAFRVPPHMIGHTDKTTSWGSGIEQMGIGFVQYTLDPHLHAIEQEINRKFYRTAANFVEFNREGLLRGDSKARSEFYGRAIGGPGSGDGWMTINEVRAKENMPAAPGGDELYRAPRDPGVSNANNVPPA